MPTISASANAVEFCLGESKVLSESYYITGTTFNWSVVLGSCLSLTVSPTTTTTYSVTLTTLEGCTGTAEVTVTVQQYHKIKSTSNPIDIWICQCTEIN